MIEQLDVAKYEFKQNNQNYYQILIVNVENNQSNFKKSSMKNVKSMVQIAIEKNLGQSASSFIDYESNY